MPFDSKNASDAKIGFHFRSSVAEIFHFSSHLTEVPVPLFAKIYLFVSGYVIDSLKKDDLVH